MFLCVVIMCSSLTEPTNGDIEFATDTTAPYNFGTEATYSCEEGYDVVMGNTTRTCDGDGTTIMGSWTDQTPSCGG